MGNTIIFCISSLRPNISYIEAYASLQSMKIIVSFSTNVDNIGL